MISLPSLSHSLLSHISPLLLPLITSSLISSPFISCSIFYPRLLRPFLLCWDTNKLQITLSILLLFLFIVIYCLSLLYFRLWLTSFVIDWLILRHINHSIFFSLSLFVRLPRCYSSSSPSFLPRFLLPSGIYPSAVSPFPSLTPPPSPSPSPFFYYPSSNSLLPTLSPLPSPLFFTPLLLPLLQFPPAFPSPPPSPAQLTPTHSPPPPSLVI